MCTRWTGTKPAAGVISRREFDAAIEAVGAEAIGDYLVDSCGMDRGQLLNYVRDEMQAIIQSLFAWTEGRYRFRPGLPADAPSVDLERTK